MKFRTTLWQDKTRNVVGIIIPAEVVEGLGSGQRPPITVTINGYTYRNTVASMGGKYMVGVAAEHRAKAGVEGGETVDVEIELDTAPREVVLPADFRQALRAADALKRFEELAYTYRKEHVRAVEEAKTAETRARRIERAVQKVLAGKK